MLHEPWRITLCGGLSARQGTHFVARFRTQKTGLLLAYLALYSERTHGREEVAELFWPESERPLHSLRMALGSLRQQLEPPGVGRGQVLRADRSHIGLVRGTVHTDVEEFRTAVANATRTAEVGQKTQQLRQGIDAVAGELLPGSYLDWVLRAREIVSEQMQSALKDLVLLLTSQGEAEQALPYALRRVHLNPLNEEAHLSTMQLLMRLERPADVLRQFEFLSALLQEELGVAPSNPAQELAAACFSVSKTALSASSVGSARAFSASRVAPFSSSAVPVVPQPVVSSSPSSASQFCAQAPSAAAKPVVRLPLPLTSFFGREKEVSQLYALLAPRSAVDLELESFPVAPRPQRARVLTLLGTGGSGKTRLAIETGRACAAGYGTSVCFVALVDADTPEYMVQLIAESVCPSVPVDSDPLLQIVSALGAGSALLILDNMEQIAEAGADLVGDLLERLPNLTILVTSRQRLNLVGESEFPLLPLPTPQHVDSPECLLEFASVQLFVERAQAARADFQLTVRNAANVAALCRRLEGLPLAMELAASWAQTLSPAQMLTRLDRRFELLRTRHKGVPTRHQALEACIEWSYRLLDPEVQACFCRLCLLRGDWTLETAEAIDADEAALDKVQRLREASFLLARESLQADGPVLRFYMLESLREFGLKQLTPAESDAGYERLAQYLIAAPLVEEFALIHTENVRAAVHWCRHSARGAELELSLLNALKVFFFSRGVWIEGRHWVQEALRRHAGEETSTYRNAWNMLGSLHWLLRETAEAKRCFEEALTAAEKAGDGRLAVRALNNLAMTATQEGDLMQACTLGEQSLRFAQRLGDEMLVTALLNNLGSAHMALKQYEAAREYLEQSLQRSRQQGTPGMIGSSLANLGAVAHSLGDGWTARQMYEEALEILRACEDQSGVAEVLGLLSEALEEQGELKQAHRLREERASLLERLEGG